MWRPDEVEGDWVQVMAVPGLLQVTDFRPPNFQPTSLTAQGFGMTLETFAPKVLLHFLEASTDLKTWRPIVSYTNVPGTMTIQE